MPTHLFRNVRISSINGTVIEARPIIRFHVRSEIMPDIADHMKWPVLDHGSLLGGIDSVSLTGSMALRKATFDPNGMKEFKTSVDAIEARDFKITAKGKKSEDGNGPSAELQFTITFPAETGTALMEYWLNVGGGDSVLKVQDAGAQEKLDLTEDKQADPPLASVRQMKKKDKVQ